MAMPHQQTRHWQPQALLHAGVSLMQMRAVAV
jgi:hypothetical protein